MREVGSTLDWNETKPGPRAAIAVIRLPAQVPVTNPRYGGAILINPGGPGGSGVNEVLTRGKLFQSIADMRNASSKSSHLALDDSLKYFDLIGFDPRAVNNSTPHLHCFPDGMARQIWDAQASAEGLFDSSDHSFNLM
jgi:pimeloyl-ACP methyl ester carboxylesterase